MSMTLYFRTDDQTRFIDTDGELNMSNANAWAFFEFCGYAPDPEDGSIPTQRAVDLLQQLRDTLLLIEASKDAGVNFDQGRETRTHASPGKATMIECGRAPGYMEARVRFAIQLCEEAISKGALFAYFV